MTTTFGTHTHRISTGGKILLRVEGDVTLVQVHGSMTAPLRDPRPVHEVAADLRGQGLDVTVW